MSQIPSTTLDEAFVRAVFHDRALTDYQVLFAIGRWTAYQPLIEFRLQEIQNKDLVWEDVRDQYFNDLRIGLDPFVLVDGEEQRTVAIDDHVFLRLEPTDNGPRLFRIAHHENPQDYHVARDSEEDFDPDDGSDQAMYYYEDMADYDDEDDDEGIQITYNEGDPGLLENVQYSDWLQTGARDPNRPEGAPPEYTIRSEVPMVIIAKDGRKIALSELLDMRDRLEALERAIQEVDPVAWTKIARQKTRRGES